MVKAGAVVCSATSRETKKLCGGKERSSGWALTWSARQVAGKVGQNRGCDFGQFKHRAGTSFELKGDEST